eukprot:m.140383 g.140383  ORF g.140383 m.140383 type:complete len:336 (-) comp17662_c0_seq3:270-1277(-)
MKCKAKYVVLCATVGLLYIWMVKHVHMPTNVLVHPRQKNTPISPIHEKSKASDGAESKLGSEIVPKNNIAGSRRSYDRSNANHKVIFGDDDDAAVIFLKSKSLNQHDLKRQDEVKAGRKDQQKHAMNVGTQHAVVINEEKVMVECTTTKGVLRMIVNPLWAPYGAERFLRMVRDGFFSAQVPLYRCVQNWVCQFGYTKDPTMTKKWDPPQHPQIQDDPQWLDLRPEAKPWMRKGLVSFAGGGPNTRTQHFFFATANIELGKALWEVPFAELADDASLAVLDSFYKGYGELRVFHGNAPDGQQIQERGGAYLESEYPLLDYITGCTVVEDEKIPWD